MAQDDEAECQRYNRIIHSMGGIDLQLLGLGHNGHIGFNEPDEAFEKETHLVALTQSTIDANSRLFDNPDDVPQDMPIPWELKPLCSQKNSCRRQRSG